MQDSLWQSRDAGRSQAIFHMAFMTYLQLATVDHTLKGPETSPMSAAFAEKRFGLAGKKAVVTGLTCHVWHGTDRSGSPSKSPGLRRWHERHWCCMCP